MYEQEYADINCKCKTITDTQVGKKLLSTKLREVSRQFGFPNTNQSKPNHYATGTLERRN